MSREEHTEFELSLTLEDGYRFTVEFGREGVPPLLLDEPPPLGEGSGPNAARILGAAPLPERQPPLLHAEGPHRVAEDHDHVPGHPGPERRGALPDR